LSVPAKPRSAHLEQFRVPMILTKQGLFPDTAQRYVTGLRNGHFIHCDLGISEG